MCFGQDQLGIFSIADLKERLTTEHLAGLGIKGVKARRLLAAMQALSASDESVGNAAAARVAQRRQQQLEEEQQRAEERYQRHKFEFKRLAYRCELNFVRRRLPKINRI